MRIMFDDDLGQRIVMECSTVAAVPVGGGFGDF